MHVTYHFKYTVPITRQLNIKTALLLTPSVIHPKHIVSLFLGSHFKDFLAKTTLWQSRGLISVTSPQLHDGTNWKKCGLRLNSFLFCQSLNSLNYWYVKHTQSSNKIILSYQCPNRSVRLTLVSHFQIKWSFYSTVYFYLSNLQYTPLLVFYSLCIKSRKQYLQQQILIPSYVHLTN